MGYLRGHVGVDRVVVGGLQVGGGLEVSDRSLSYISDPEVLLWIARSICD
jgi:hypothetical protein